MALNNPKELYLKIFKRVTIIVLLLVIMVANIHEFKRLVSTNPEKITEYQSPRDIYAEIRNPVILITYYTVSDKMPKIAILPEQHFDNVIQSLGKNFKKGQIQKIFIGMLAGVAKEKVEFFNKEDLFDGVPFKIFTDQDILQSKQKDFVSLLETDRNFLILIGNLKDDKFAEMLKMVETTAVNLNLRPVAKDLLAIQKVFLEKKSQGLDTLNLEQQYANLETFIKDQQESLQKLIKQALDNDLDNVGEIKKNRHFDDKAAVYVLAVSEEENLFREYGEVSFEKSVAKGISFYVAEAKKDFPESDIKIFLLTESERKNYADEKEFEAALQRGYGIVLTVGNRRGILLPCFWETYPNKKEFIKQLKIKSGISPDYWSEEINIYYFKAAEIPYHEN